MRPLLQNKLPCNTQDIPNDNKETIEHPKSGVLYLREATDIEQEQELGEGEE